MPAGWDDGSDGRVSPPVEESPAEPLSVQQAREMGFDQEQIDYLLREDLELQHQRRLREVDAEIAWTKFQLEQAKALVWAALPLKPDGEPRKLSLDLPHGRFSFRRSKGGRKLVEPALFLDWLRERGAELLDAGQGALLRARVTALRVQETYTGLDALPRLLDGTGKAELLKTPIQEYLADLPETVELPPGCLAIEPGVTWSLD